jgi:hypothetical protein
MTHGSPPQHAAEGASAFPDRKYPLPSSLIHRNLTSIIIVFFEVSSQIVLLSQAISELTFAVSTLNDRVAEASPLSSLHLVLSTSPSARAELDPSHELNVVSTGDPTEASTREPGVESTVIPAGEVAATPDTTSAIARACARASMRAAVHAALSAATPLVIPDTAPHVIPSVTSPGGLTAEPVVSHVTPSSGLPPYETLVDASMGRHWYLVTKGLQTGVFQSW